LHNTASVEPSASPQRPAEILILALFAGLAAITHLVLAVVGSQSVTSTRDVIVAAAFAVYGVSRLAAGYGLLRLKTYGSLLERMSSCVWIALAVFVIIVRTPFALVVFFPGIAIGIGAFVYLSRPSTRALFSGGGLRLNAAAVVVLVVIGVVVSVIAIKVNRVSNSGEQKRTMADMRTIATAWEARATDFNRYNAAAVTFPTTGVTAENLVTSLTPTYVNTFPQHDGWGNNWQFGADQPWDSKNAAHSYAIISYGKDGRAEGRWNGGAITNFDCDIVYSNGLFIQYPNGVQQQ
jgi:type II secretory pathway pseudopilin PulG